MSKLTKDERLDLIDWLTSGGKPTFSEFISLSKADRMDFIEFLKSFSMYEDITINGKRFVLTHAGLGGFSEDKLMNTPSTSLSGSVPTIQNAISATRILSL